MKPPRRTGKYASSVSAISSSAGIGDDDFKRRSFSSSGGVQESLRRPQRLLRIGIHQSAQRHFIGQELRADMFVTNRCRARLGPPEEENDRFLDQSLPLVPKEVGHLVPKNLV